MTRDDFPYIQAIQANNCFAVKDTSINIFENGVPFRHLILTGKNGSGKTSIVKAIDDLYSRTRNGENIEQALHSYSTALIQQPGSSAAEEWKKYILNSTRVTTLNNIALNTILKKKANHVYSFFEAQRLISVQDVSSPIKEQDIIDHIFNKKGLSQINNSQNSNRFSQFFKHYLVNKKIEQAFDIIDDNKGQIQSIQDFFSNLENLFQNIFEDKNLKFVFLREDYDFKLIHSDGREVSFNQLSSGFSAFLDILSELIVQVDLIRKSRHDNSFNPPGLVLIDEPENHAHLSMQEQILPLLTSLFPNVQFIVATHSPAVIASIKNATVFDLSSKQTFREGLVGSSYSQLMVTLFGLKNQYSHLADQLIEEVNQLLSERDKNKAREGLNKILEEKKELLSPSILLEIESAILQIQEDHDQSAA